MHFSVTAEWKVSSILLNNMENCTSLYDFFSKNMSYINKKIFLKDENKGGRVYTVESYILFLRATKAEIKSSMLGHLSLQHP